MKLRDGGQYRGGANTGTRLAEPGNSRCRAFTLVEVMVAIAIAMLVVGGLMLLIQFSAIYLSGIASQSVISQRAGNTVEFIESRVRLATSVSNNASGNSLTLSFDNDYTVDSDGDGKPYDDKDHFERFTFLGTNGSTNNSATNSLVYIPDITTNYQRVLIPSGVHNLPGSKIFTVTNQTAITQFGIEDPYVADRFQGVDIQATAVPLNRPTATNFIAILP